MLFTPIDPMIAIFAFTLASIATGSVFGVMLARLSRQKWQVLAILGILYGVLSGAPVVLVLTMASQHWWLFPAATIADLVFIGTYVTVYIWCKKLFRRRNGWE